MPTETRFNKAIAAAAICLSALAAVPGAAQNRVERYSVHETSFEASRSPANPYVEIRADAEIRRPDGGAWTLPLFWDGARTWKLRISPDMPGKWSFAVASNDPGIDGRTGAFVCVESSRPGGLRASAKWPSHFERQNGQPFWFMGDTAWGYFTDSAENNHHRPQGERYARKRAAQGFNVIHSMLLSEHGVGNNNGFPFEDISAEKINTAYWQEVDRRLAFANAQGLTVGLAIAWGDKRRVEPFAWRRFPNLEARKRYARYAAARYGAYDVYFIVAGEWHGEVRTRGNSTEDEVFREFVALGDALSAANPHGRMVGIHPMSAHGSVREFASAAWMSFADYQQNYRNLYARAALSRNMRGPVVNSEYGYYLRDQSGDGRPDKDNSHTVEDMRYSTWDIAMAGAYFVTGFGTTYFGGHRDPGPFDPDAAKNADWELQVGLTRKLFEQLEWWKLAPAAGLLSCTVPRGADRRWDPQVARGRKDLRPPETTYWALADPGETYLVYVRGTTEPVELDTEARARRYRLRMFDPRTGEFASANVTAELARHTLRAPDRNDWLFLFQAVK